MKTNSPLAARVDFEERRLSPGGLLLTERALEVCNLPSGARIADVGCGAGAAVEWLSLSGDYDPVGIDQAEAPPAEGLPRLAPGRLLRGRAESLPFRNNCFDALFCECVLSLVEKRPVALREFSRVVKKGGFLTISDLFVREGDAETACREDWTGGQLRKEDLLALVAKLGFATLLWEEHDRLLREFVARRILEEGSFPAPRACRDGFKEKKGAHGRIGYFLLVARKERAAAFHGESRGEGDAWTR